MLRSFILIALATVFVQCSTTKKSEQTTKTDNEKSELSSFNLTIEDRVRRLSGVNVQGSGQNAKVTVRGLSSLTNNTEALFVVDGTTVVGGLAAVTQMVNVEDIKSIRVLKSATETSRYGIQGAGGVIKIDLKKE